MRKVENTSTFEFYNANPKNRRTSDCVVRAISTALNQSYAQTLNDLMQMMLNTGYCFDDPKCFGKYLESKGWTKHNQLRKADNTKYTGAEFVKVYNGTCVANIGGHHTTCITHNKIVDIWDCSEYCIGNYWSIQ